MDDELGLRCVKWSPHHDTSSDASRHASRREHAEIAFLERKQTIARAAILNPHDRVPSLIREQVDLLRPGRLSVSSQIQRAALPKADPNCDSGHSL
jgi:hypothetical protein